MQIKKLVTRFNKWAIALAPLLAAVAASGASKKWY